jgi:hypothetical protein
MGLRTRDRPAIGAWSDGAENSIMTEIDGGTFDQLRVAAAMKAHIADQKATLIFQEQDGGDAHLYHFEATGELADIHANLLKDGVAFHTIIPNKGGGATVYSVDLEGGAEHDIARAASRYGSKVRAQRGRAEFVGTAKQDGTDREQRDDARENYERVIGGSGDRAAQTLWQRIHATHGAKLDVTKDRRALAMTIDYAWTEDIDFDPADHPRGGNPKSPGEFSKGPGGGGAAPETKAPGPTRGATAKHDRPDAPAPSSNTAKEVRAEKGKAARATIRAHLKSAREAVRAAASAMRIKTRAEAATAREAAVKAEKAGKLVAKVAAAREPPSAILHTPKHEAAISTRIPSEPQQRLTGVDVHKLNTSVVDWQSATMPQASEWLEKASNLLTGKSQYTPGRNAKGKANPPVEYIGMRPGPPGETPKQAAERFISFAQGNILALYNAVPMSWRADASKWYDGAQTLTTNWSKDYNYTPQQIAGAIAAMSPKKDWFQNVDITKRLMDYRRDYAKGGKFENERFDTKAQAAMLDMMSRSGDKRKAEFQAIFDRIKGQRLQDLTTSLDQATWINMHDMGHGDRRYKKISPEGKFSDDWMTNKEADTDDDDDDTSGNAAAATASTWATGKNIAKAIDILNDGSTENISKNLGEAHKVRNFYMNIIDPMSKDGHVTIDTHAIAGAFLRPLGQKNVEVQVGLGNSSPSDNTYGLGGTYPMIAEAYRRAAASVNPPLLPRQMQSIAWESMRGIFTPEGKRDKKLRAAVDNRWKTYMHTQSHSPEEEAKQLAATRASIMRLGSPELRGVPRTPSWKKS